MAPRKKGPAKGTPSPYVAPKELARRWQVSRTSADRIARREGFTAVFLGEGKSGAVRYLMEEVLAYEESRKVRLTP